MASFSKFKKPCLFSMQLCSFFHIPFLVLTDFVGMEKVWENSKAFCGSWILILFLFKKLLLLVWSGQSRICTYKMDSEHDYRSNIYQITFTENSQKDTHTSSLGGTFISPYTLNWKYDYVIVVVCHIRTYYSANIGSKKSFWLLYRWKSGRDEHCINGQAHLRVKVK